MRPLLGANLAEHLRPGVNNITVEAANEGGSKALALTVKLLSEPGNPLRQMVLG